MKHKHFIVFCVFVFLFCIIYICLNFINIDKNLLYSTNKLYAILDEQYRPGFAGAVENPRLAQLGKTDKKIVFELVDATHETEPYKDTFYAILTEDKNLKYYNGYIFPSRIVNGLGEGETLDILGLSNLKKTDANGRFTLQSGLFEFQILYKEYSVKLTDLQYVKIISLLNKIDGLDKNELYYVYGEEEFAIKGSDLPMYKGLCLKSGYFDSRVEWYPGEDKSETEKQYLSLYNELYFYIQSIIPNFEPYEFGKM